MPIIEVLNWPDVELHELGEVREALRTVCLGIKEFRLEKLTQVTVCFLGDPAFRDDLEGHPTIVRVRGLFEKPERTRAARQRLADELARTAHRYFGGWIEVLIERFDPEREAYAVIAPSPDDQPRARKTETTIPPVTCSCGTKHELPPYPRRGIRTTDAMERVNVARKTVVLAAATCAHGVLTKTAELLGVSRGYFYELLGILGLTTEDIAQCARE